MATHIKTILAALLTMLALASCQQEIMDVNERLDDLEKRVSALEKLCGEMNSNISSLQGIVSALQTGDYITSVNPITEGGKTVGYTITFAKGNPITIYHGQDGADGKDGTNGQDGHTPVIGIKQDTDGVWYWTLDGDWQLDSNNQKVKAVGQDGKDGQNGQGGITPQLRIEDGYWYVSTDNGATWAQLEKATGENGLDGKDGRDGESIFQSVNVTETEVTFVTSDGQTFVISRATLLSIEFDLEDLVVMGTNAARDIHYTITSDADDVTIEALSSADIKVKVVKTDAKTGVLQIKTSDTIDEYSKVVVLVSNGSQAIMRTIRFEEEAIIVDGDTTKEVPDAGGLVSLDFFSNIEYHIAIPLDAKDWISVVPCTKVLSHKQIELMILTNYGAERSAEIMIEDIRHNNKITYLIIQSENHNIQIELERASLIDLFECGDGEQWPSNESYSWCTDAPLSEWQGITTNQDGFVTSISIPIFHGRLPNSIGNFSALETLSIGGEFIGTLPEAITKLKHLKYLNIYRTNIQHKEELGLSGDIDYDWSLLQELEYFRIAEQNLSGPLPTSFCKLTRLKELILPGNKFTGTIPSEFGLLEYLENFSIPGNCLEGEIPKTFSKLCSLKILDLSGYQYDDERARREHKNAFYGDLSFISGLTSLEQLDLSFNEFSGTIPDLIWTMPNLTDLDIKGNNFSGTISSEIGKSSLSGIRIGNNLLYGELPDEFWHLSTLTTIDLTNSFMVGDATLDNFNHFSGGISQLSSCTNLVSFHASNNDFDGTIPDDIGKLQNLSELVLYRNNLSGSLPDGMKEMENLIIFWCNYNRLSGVLSKELSSVIQQKNWVISPQQDGYNLTPELYESTDYSRHEEIRVLQKAQEGRGIDIILAGDAYSDADIASGEYDYAIELMYEALFAIEPFRSFKNLFNVYELVLVSKNDCEYGETALGIKTGQISYYDADTYNIRDYCHSLLPATDYDNAIITIVTKINDAAIGESYIGASVNVLSASYNFDEDYFKQVFQHETIGHGFGKLADEYYDDGTITENDLTILSQLQQLGYYLNVDKTADPKEVLWSKFLSLPQYANEDLGIYEGGYHYTFGIWRPSLTSIMGSGGTTFNAPSREIIYKRIHELAYGTDWTYNFDEFLDWDKGVIEAALPFHSQSKLVR